MAPHFMECAEEGSVFPPLSSDSPQTVGKGWQSPEQGVLHLPYLCQAPFVLQRCVEGKVLVFKAADVVGVRS